MKLATNSLQPSSQKMNLTAASGKIRSVSMGPRQAVAVALAIGFVVFALLESIDASLSNSLGPAQIRMFHFLMAFIACAAGMAFVWYQMSQQERELTRLRNGVATELERRTWELHQATRYFDAERAALEKELFQQREDFLAVISHRLRTPILANERIVSLFLAGDFGNLPPNQAEIFEHLAQNNTELDRLLRMLVDIYRYRNGNKQLNKQLTRVSEIINASIGTARALAKARDVSLVTRLGYAKNVSCDPVEFATLISHVVENAVRHARSKVIIETAELGGHILIRICDDGKGIVKQDLETLFDRFYTVSGDGRYAPATGTGLCLCAEIIKAHGGTITCKSEPEQGCTFTVALPTPRAIEASIA